MSVRFSTFGDALFCGSSSEIDNLFNDGATAMGWLHLDGYGNGDFGRMFDKSTTAQLGWEIFVDGNSGFNRILFQRDFSGGQGSWATNTGTIVTGVWYHFAVTYSDNSSANDPLFYLDGELVTVNEVLTPSGTMVNDAAQNLYIGNRAENDRHFNGRLSDLRLYDRILSAAEIQEIFTLRSRDRILDSLVRRFAMSPTRHGLGLNTPFRHHSSGSSSDASSIVGTMPNNVDGDLLVMVVVAGGITSGTPATITTPSGWTQRLHLALPSTVTTPRLGVYTRAASSEPASYTININQTCPLIYWIGSYAGAATAPTDVVSDTGTSVNPLCPSVTPGANALVLRIAVMDNSAQQPSISWTYYPPNARGRVVISDSNGTENGAVLGVAEESLSGAASGTREFSPVGSDQWGTATLSFLWGDGIEGLPVKDFSLSQDHAESYGGVIGDEEQF